MTSIAAAGLILATAIGFFGSETQHAAARSRKAEKEVLLTRAWRSIDMGDLEAAEAQVAEFNRLFRGDPQGHLVLASGYARHMRQMDMERELAQARDLDGWAGVVDDQSAMGLFLQALQWLAAEKSAAYARVQDNLERALALDPKLEVAFFLLYGVRKELGDLDGARAALEAYRGTLRTSHPAVPFVDVLLVELGEDYELALAQLEALRAKIGDLEFSEIRGFRALGRVLLNIYRSDRQKHAGRLTEAEAVLTQAANDVPGDVWTWTNLALVHQHEWEQTQNPDRRRELLERVETCARRALELDPMVTAAREALAWAEWHRLLAADQAARAQQGQALQTALDELEAVAPESPLLRYLSSELAHSEGVDAYRAGEETRAVALFERSAELHPTQIGARLMLGEIAWMNGRFEASLNWLQDAEEAWNHNEALGARADPNLRFEILVWTVGAADKLDRVDLASESLERAREMWLAREGVAFSEAISLAEFVSMPDNDELRDCELARAILAVYSSSAIGDEQAALVKKISEACY